MKRFLARVLLPVLAAVIIPATSLAVAHADPAYGSTLRCNGPVQVAPEISVKTCTYYFWWDYGFHWSHRARVTVRNTSASFDVSVRPDLIVDSWTVAGDTHTIARGTEEEVWGNYVQDLPSNVRKTGAAYVVALGWSTYTYGPTF